MFLQKNSSGVWSPQNPWPLLSQALGQPSSIRKKLHLMEWVLNPIRYSLVTLISGFVSLLQQYILQASHHFRLKGLLLVRCLHFSFGSNQSTLYYHEHLSLGVKAFFRQQLDFSSFNMLCWCCLQQQILLSDCREQVIVLTISWVDWGHSYGALLGISLNRGNSFLSLETSFVDKNVQLDSFSPVIW